MGVSFPSALTELLFCPPKLSEILKFGLDKLLSTEGSTVSEVDLESILGETKDGQWSPDTLPEAAEGGGREQEEGSKILRSVVHVELAFVHSERWISFQSSTHGRLPALFVFVLFCF